LPKPKKRALEHEAERFLAVDEKTRIIGLFVEPGKLGMAFHHAGLVVIFL